MSKRKSAIPSVIRWVKVTDLVIGAQYQRTINEQKVARMAENFDPFQFGVPTVSEREDGTLHVTDGQHRIMAVRKMGWDDQMIQVEVIPSQTYEEEAGTHVDRNANRTSTSTIDRFFGNLEARRPVQVAIKKMCDDRGLEIIRYQQKRKDAAEGIIWAVGTLEKLYIRGGSGLVTKTLDTILEVWGPVADAFQSPVLRAVARLHEEYDRMIDMTRLVKSMKRFRPAEYIKRAEAGRELNRANKVNNLVVALVADYNNLPGGRKLPPATSLVDKSIGGRITVKDRAQVIELFQNGYSKAEVAARFEGKVKKAGIDRIFRDGVRDGTIKKSGRGKDKKPRNYGGGRGRVKAKAKASTRSR